ncbi:helicase HerA domain-containing protein [Candidatus Halobonum tyrrellensis]|uniref:Conjugation protein n=1 Tax=Candidatus Halobonum tyrrellensis G22 TaxID=1324957 RepID=V4IUH2_9EURY|nr:DUF87 domain-containing protein [Candidatus Halobonum tyrrellensis]ESP86822.1 conjugation protein [Candidatus Halobonum tyrrellensis G22]
MSDAREYLRVRPSSQSLHTEAIPRLIESLHKVTVEESTSGFMRLLPGDGSYPPQFEFLALSEGADEPVEFYVGADGDLTTLEDRLESMYPTTFDIDRVEMDIAHRLVHPVEYQREEFVDRLDSDSLYYTPSAEDMVDDGTSGLSILGDGGLVTKGGTEEDRDDAADSDEQVDDPDDEEDTPDPTAVEYSNGTFRLDDAQRGVDPTTLTRPTLTDDGTVLARPPLGDLAPMGVRWHALAEERKQDWMMTIADFHDQTASPSDDSERRVPLATIIDHLVEAEAPIAFQVVFRKKPDWSPDAWQRKHDIKHNLDTWYGKIWDFIEPTTPDDHELSDRDEMRLDQLDDKQPKRTFTVNARAVAIPSNDETEEELDTRLDALASGFDSLDGEFYQFSGHRLRRSGFRQSKKEQYARNALERLLDRELVTGGRKTRFDFTLNASELANLITVPSGENLSMEGRRGTDAKQESQNPLQRPAPDHADEFHDTGGLAIGRALDETGTPEDDPTYVPPSLLPTHYGRFGTTGSGKSKALINDALSLYEHTDGPIVLVDPKGDGLPENYMRSHAARFGVDDMEQNVVHFSIPDVLPGFSFFNLQPALDNGLSRIDAIQRTADHYEEILKLTMGSAKYESATVAPTLIRALISALFDSEHGRDNGQYRADEDYFAHRQLEYALDQLWQAGPPEPQPELAPQSSDPDDRRRIDRQLQLDQTAFSRVMGGVSNRLAYVSQDGRLRDIFNNTDQEFDFREVLDENTVVIFDLGDLRAEPTKLLSGLILSNLEDALREQSDSLSEKPEEYVVNLLVDEAASVVTSDIMNRLLEQGRGFRLSVGLSMQFPEQIEEEGGRRLYLNALNNIGTTLVGKISVDREIAEAMAHEEMSPREFKDRIASLPRGEWIAQVPSPTFGETGPKPFSVDPLPIPEGHPESDDPFTGEESKRVENAIDRIQTQTDDEFGVPEPEPEPRDSPEDVQERLSTANADLDQALARVVRTIQLRHEVREENGEVPVEEVDEELRELFTDGEVEPPSYDELGAVRERSQLLAVGLDTEEDQLVISLTERGEEAVAPDTGDVQAAGSEDHDNGVYEAERALTTAGFNATVVPQDGSEQPDGRATHPELDDEFVIEVETTTPANPVKVLTNLRKAQDEEAIPLFVVRPEEKDSYWADRIEGILHPPVKEIDNHDETRLYTFDEQLEVRHVETGQRLTAVRPATSDDDTRMSMWRRDEETGDAVLPVEGESDDARIQRVDTAMDRDVPAVYTYDPDINQYIVLENEATYTYDSKETFETEWVPIKKPFIPERELPVPNYTRDAYAIVILPEGGDPVVYREGETAPIETLVDDGPQLATPAADDQLNPAEPTTDESLPDEPDESAEEMPTTTEPNETEVESDTAVTAEAAEESESASSIADLDKKEALGIFADQHLTETDEDVAIQKSKVYSAYESWAEDLGIETVTHSWFTRRLKNYITFETDRRREDGDIVRYYVGFTLDETEDVE